jgi:hypothetical protein
MLTYLLGYQEQLLSMEELLERHMTDPRLPM